MKMRNFVAMAAVAAVFTGTMAWAGTASAKSFNVSSPDGKCGYAGDMVAGP